MKPVNQPIAMQRLPEKFLSGPKSEALAKYIARKYGPYGFRKGKGIMFNPEWEPEGRRGNRYRWVENASDGLRVVGEVHEIAKREGWHGLKECGWYVDNHQSETTVAMVFQLPARDGRPVYVPGNSDPYNSDCAVIDFNSTTEELRDSCQWAQGMAESYAEDAREGEAKSAAESRIEDIATEIADLRAQFKALAVETRATANAIGPEVCKLIKREARAMRREVGKLVRERGELQADYWKAVARW